MKILFVASGNSRFGISPIVKSQGESLVKVRVEVKKNIEIEYFAIAGKGILNYLKHISLLKRHLLKNKYDLIHAHYGLCGIVAQLARGKEKLVVSFMGDDLIGAVNNNGNYSLFGYVLVLMNKLFLRKYDYVIVKSKELSEKVNSENKEVIPNGVDLNNFYEMNMHDCRKRLNLDLNKHIILFAADPNRQEKNYKLAQMAYETLKDENIILKVIYGVPQSDLVKYYNASNCILMTSLHEGSPNVIKEAMACNRPIVSTPVGDVLWLLKEIEGCYIAKFDPNDIAEKIKRAIEYSETMKKTKAREKILSLGLDSHTTAKKIVEVYQKLIE